MKKNWHAVYTKLNCELRVTAQLNRKKIENFCPVNNVSNNTGYRKKWTSIPLFQSLVFVYVSETEMSAVKQTGDILNFLYWLGVPAVISIDEIENIERFANDYNHIKIEKSAVNPCAASQITSYSQKDNMSSSHTVVKMLLPSLGFTIMASVETATIKVFNPMTGNKRTQMS
jgi:transcriptional antiterminator NusG